MRQGEYQADYKVSPQWRPLLAAAQLAAEANRTASEPGVTIEVVFPLIANSTAERLASGGAREEAGGGAHAGFKHSGGSRWEVGVGSHAGTPFDPPAAAVADWGREIDGRWGEHVALRPHGRAQLEVVAAAAVLPVGSFWYDQAPCIFLSTRCRTLLGGVFCMAHQSGGKACGTLQHGASDVSIWA